MSFRIKRIALTTIPALLLAAGAVWQPKPLEPISLRPAVPASPSPQRPVPLFAGRPIVLPPAGQLLEGLSHREAVTVLDTLHAPGAYPLSPGAAECNGLRGVELPAHNPGVREATAYCYTNGTQLFDVPASPRTHYVPGRTPRPQ